MLQLLVCDDNIDKSLGKFLQQTASSIKHKDENVVKILTGILVRSLPWKKKVRKLLEYHHRREENEEGVKSYDGMEIVGVIASTSCELSNDIAASDPKNTLDDVTTMTTSDNAEGG